MKVSKSSAEFSSALALRSVTSRQTSIPMSGSFGREAPTNAPASPKAQLSAFEVQELPEEKWVEVFAQSSAGCECIWDFVRSAGHRSIAFAPTEGLAALLKRKHVSIFHWPSLTRMDVGFPTPCGFFGTASAPMSHCC